MAESKLCPYLLQGKCDTPNCPFIHGLLCETCGLHCLIPDFPEQNEKHRKGLYIEKVEYRGYHIRLIISSLVDAHWSATFGFGLIPITCLKYRTKY